MENKGDLSGLSRTSGAFYDDDLIFIKGIQDFLPMLVHRKMFHGEQWLFPFYLLYYLLYSQTWKILPAVQMPKCTTSALNILFCEQDSKRDMVLLCIFELGDQFLLCEIGIAAYTGISQSSGKDLVVGTKMFVLI
jgi:hypothetical protein